LLATGLFFGRNIFSLAIDIQLIAGKKFEYIYKVVKKRGMGEE